MKHDFIVRSFNSESQLTTEPTFTTLSTINIISRMNQLEENRVRRKRILQEALEESDSDDHDEEEGIYTSTNKKILSEIREGQRLRKKEIDDRIRLALNFKISQLKKDNISYDYRKLRKDISESIYEQWAFEKVSGDSELAR